MLSKNQKVTLTVTDLNNLGYGVAHHEGLTIFVSGALDGEVVEAQILAVKKTYCVARTLSILSSSPHRIPNDCSAKGCGGCAYRLITYQHEKEIKRECVAGEFRKVGLPHVEIEPVVSTDVTCHYRNKAQYPISQGKDGGYEMGFYAPHSHRVVDGVVCPLQPQVFAEILGTLRAFFTAYHLSVYDETTGQGLLRHVYLRRGTATGEILLTLVVNDTFISGEEALISAITSAHKEVVGILLNTNMANTNVICGDRWRTLWGRDYIEDVLCGVRLRLSAPSFYQVNHDATELLYQHAARLAGLTGKEQVLDLYCGVGSIGLSMAHLAGEVIGAEIVREAVENAKENAQRNGIHNAHFYCCDATDPFGMLTSISERGPITPDVVILDPPRKGCDSALLDYLAAREVPRIVYISCNPATLARDVKYLLSLGYSLASPVTPFDLFPRTGHVESLVCLTKQTN